LVTFTTAIEGTAWDSTPAIKGKLNGLILMKEIEDQITEKTQT
jgi:hypothetical protein